MNWDENKIRERFAQSAEQAAKYLSNISQNDLTSDGLTNKLDENLANFSVYNYLQAHTFIASREKLIDKLHDMLNNPIDAPSGAYDPQKFIQHWTITIKSLIQEFKNT